MILDVKKFYNACDPSKTLIMGNESDRQYYIDFASVRGGKIIEALKRTITRADKPTCQLFTGHIGCGKSTELSRLKAELEQQGFHVVDFESTHDLDMADVDITDILLAITRQVSESLEAINIKLKPGYFVNLFQEITDFLATPIDLSATAELSLGIAKITAHTQDNKKERDRLRSYLEPRTTSLLESINEEVLGRATQELKRRGKQGLVVIVDNLDRVDNSPKGAGGRLQPEYLFVDRGDQLRQLNCHVVYTIPLALIFSTEGETLKQRLGGGLPPKVLSMVPVQLRDGTEFEQGMALLRQMVLARAFPELAPEERLNLISKVFDSPQTLDRLCRISGGHVRNLLGLLYRCLQEEDPPLSQTCLESVVREFRDSLVLGINEHSWDLLRQVLQQQTVGQEADSHTMLRSLWVFEYIDREGRWFGLNPVLAETAKFKSWQL